jgi:hypothetical protein
MEMSGDGHFWRGYFSITTLERVHIADQAVVAMHVL